MMHGPIHIKFVLLFLRHSTNSSNILVLQAQIQNSVFQITFQIVQWHWTDSSLSVFCVPLTITIPPLLHTVCQHLIMVTALTSEMSVYLCQSVRGHDPQSLLSDPEVSPNWWQFGVYAKRTMEKSHDLCCSPNIGRVIKSRGTGEKRGV